MSVAEKLGWAFSVICRRACYLDYPVASLQVWLMPPAQLSQIHIFVSDDERLLGYMTWAWFSRDTEARWKSGDLEVLHISEWNEGDRLWIIDFVTLPGYTALCMKMAPLVFPPGTCGRSLARRPLGATLAATEWIRDDGKHRCVRRKRAR